MKSTYSTISAQPNNTSCSSYLLTLSRPIERYKGVAVQFARNMQSSSTRGYTEGVEDYFLLLHLEMVKHEYKSSQTAVRPVTPVLFIEHIFQLS